MLAKALASGSWTCKSDPSQTGRLKATSGTCVANVVMEAGTNGPLRGECEKAFAVESAALYGGVLLAYAALLKTCPPLKV